MSVIDFILSLGLLANSLPAYIFMFKGFGCLKQGDPDFLSNFLLMSFCGRTIFSS